MRAKAKIIGHYFSMMPSRMRLEVRSQFKLKFDPGASTLDALPPPWEAQRPPGVELSPCLPAALVDLYCRALDYRHVYIVLNGPSVAALRCFSLKFLFFKLLLCVDTSCKLLRKIINFDLRFTITILFRHALRLILMRSDSHLQILTSI